MRISEQYRVIIKETFDRHFPSGKLYLFGSRTDDTKRGGDIDLLILTEKKFGFRLISKFNSDLIRNIGDRKIDIINYTFNDESPFLKLIMLEAEEI